MDIVATLIADFYKFGHVWQMDKKAEILYATWTPRASLLKGINTATLFNLQGFIKQYLLKYFDKNFFDLPLEYVLKEHKDVIENCLFIKDPDLTHIKDLHDLGYLPLEIWAVPEGTSVPLRTPMFTIQNTDKRFPWLPNSLETFISCEMWPSITTATIAKHFREMLNCWAIKTNGSTVGVEFQLHDFSLRGLEGFQAGAAMGAGVLLSTKGTDNVPAIMYLRNLYNGVMDNGGIGGSIPATEHMVECLNMPDNLDERVQTLRYLKEVYPTGMFSRVSDTNDFWKYVSETVPSLYDEIMGRDGKFIIRPDSGNPVDIVCGTMDDFHDCGDVPVSDMDAYAWDVISDGLHSYYGENPLSPGECGDEDWTVKVIMNGTYYEVTCTNLQWNRHDKTYYYLDMYSSPKLEWADLEIRAEDKGLIETLWDIFGGITNDQGYKVLDPHIGAIYGDAITYERADLICSKLESKGFATTNIVFGVGSYTFQFNTRDSLGQAFKSPWAMVDGKDKFMSKNPKTDSGTKKSQRGMVLVNHDLSFTEGLTLADFTTLSDLGANVMRPILRDGKLLVDDDLASIRERVGLVV